jgi:uroporphyrinogen-III synthase
LPTTRLVDPSQICQMEQNSVRVALTQAQGRLEGLEEKLDGLGLTVVRVPLLETRPRLCDYVRRRGDAFANFPWLLFSSRSAVEAWRALGLSFEGPRLGAVGPATAAEIERAGVKPKILGEPPNAEGLAARFLNYTAKEGSNGPVGLPLGTLSPPWLYHRLETAGHRAVTLEVYETRTLAWPQGTEVDAVILASTSAVGALPENVACRSALITIGRNTSRAVLDRGFVPIEARAPSPEAIVEALRREG